MFSCTLGAVLLTHPLLEGEEVDSNISQSYLRGREYNEKQLELDLGYPINTFVPLTITPSVHPSLLNLIFPSRYPFTYSPCSKFFNFTIRTGTDISILCSCKPHSDEENGINNDNSSSLKFRQKFVILQRPKPTSINEVHP